MDGIISLLESIAVLLTCCFFKSRAYDGNIIRTSINEHSGNSCEKSDAQELLASEKKFDLKNDFNLLKIF